jgi:hypothetical protein
MSSYFGDISKLTDELSEQASENFPATAAALGYPTPLRRTFSEDDLTEESDEQPPAPRRFERPSESEGWTAAEATQRDALWKVLSDTAKTELRRDDLLFLRLVRGFRRADAERKRSIIEEVTTLRARYRTTPEPPLGGSLSPTDFHRAIWPTEIVGRDPWGHLIVVERVKDVDFDRLLEMPIDAVLRLRVQALDALQRLSAQKRKRGPHRVYKCVFVCDCEDASYAALARRETVSLASAYARLTERMYADAVWRNVVIDAPLVARAAWRVVEPILDAETRELLQFVVCSGADPAAALEDVGVPRRAFPRTARGIALADCLGGLEEASAALDAMDARAAPPPPPEPVKSFRWWPVQLFLALLLALDLYLVASRRSLATTEVAAVDALDAGALAEVEVNSSPAEEF